MALLITGAYERRKTAMNTQIIDTVRKNKPLIHHLTNQVVMNFTANGLLSFGGAPIMAKAEEEAGAMVRLLMVCY